MSLCKGNEIKTGLTKRGQKVLGRTVRPIAFAVDFENADGALVAHALFGNTHHFLVVVAECDPLHSSREFPFVQTFAIGDIPETERVVCRARHKVS